MEQKNCIYIKRGPEFLGLDKISSQKMRESIERVLALRTDDNAEEVGILLGKILFGEKNGYYRLDFTGTDDFWIRTDENDKIVLRKAIIDSLITTFYSEEELDEKYISLRDFLEHAEYIGRRFVRTEQFSKQLISYYVNRPVFDLKKKVNYLKLLSSKEGYGNR